MRRFRISELVLGFLLGFASLLIILLLGSDVTFHEIGSALNDYKELITAIATIFIAWFTLSLRQSTDKLWNAGERQIELARESSAAQSSDMRASIREAIRAATAMESVAEGISLNSQAAQNSVSTMRERTAMQMRAYVSVIVGIAVYQERDRQLRFEAKPVMVNNGNTPAHAVGYKAAAAILPLPIPEDFDFPLPDERRGAAPLGPHQTFIMSALVPDYVDDVEVELIKRGNGKALYVWGVVTYRDVFGEERQTRFGQTITWLRDDSNITGYYTERHNDAT
jgi:hypothetical protein